MESNHSGLCLAKIMCLLFAGGFAVVCWLLPCWKELLVLLKNVFLGLVFFLLNTHKGNQGHTFFRPTSHRNIMENKCDNKNPQGTHMYFCFFVEKNLLFKIKEKV